MQGPEGDILASTPSQQRFCRHSRKSLKYQPVAAVGKEKGNTSWTKPQVVAAHKILAHVCAAQIYVQEDANPTILRMTLQAPARF